jgi:hypothetical protein
MNRIVKFLCIILVVSSSSGTSSYAAETSKPDFQDFYLPIIQSLSVKPIVTAVSDTNGKTLYQTSLLTELAVKVHKNSLAGFRIYYQGPTSSAENLCQSISSGIRISVGNTEYSGGEGDLQTLGGLKSRTPIGDWFLENYSLKLPVPSNQNFFPCFGNNRVTGLIIRDIAGRFKQFVNRGDGKPLPVTTEQPDVVQTSYRYDSPYRAQIPEYSCPVISGGEWDGAPIRCQDKFDPQTLQISFSAADKAAADKAAADKAAADKAAADKAAADKAAADKAAADKAAADKATAKPVTKEKSIVCTKGKSSLKVIGKNPKCPPGYKVKK